MRAIVNVGGLARAVGHVVRVLDRTRPLVTLDASDGRVTVTASGVDQWSSAWVDADVPQSGSHVVNGVWLAALTRSMPNGEINVEDNESHQVVLRGADATLRMRFAPDTLGPDPIETAPVVYPVDAERFTALISSVAYTSGNDRTIPVLNSVRLSGENGRLKAMATNRLAAARRSIEPAGDPDSGQPAPVFPEGRWLVNGQWLMDNRSGVEAIGFTDRFFQINTRNTIDTTVLTEGEFPSRLDGMWWDESTAAAIVRVDRRDLIAAASMLRAANFDSAAQTVPLHVQSVNGRLRISFDGTMGDDYQSETTGFRLLEADITGNPDFNLDVALLLGALKALDEDDVTILQPSTERGPLILRQKGDDCSQVVMPVRILGR